ncbi:MAG TPA: DUF72 domain-containing protein [Longimicrobiaceae bacterium]|nr:DUF72 domain-containing protein [Longimicrobiaceae bacterium]
MTGRIRIGCQGWNYPGWAGPLFPEGARPADYLSLYARAFDTVEVDSTFYAAPSERTVRGWVERAPEGFLFALKLPREITAERRLVGAEPVLEEFLDRARLLGPKLGPVLVQLGPDFSPAERPALKRFLPVLPADLRFAVEFRQREWINRETHDLLAGHGVALALNDGPWIPRRWLLQLAQRPTADFHYVRWMGMNRELTDFSHVQLDRSEEITVWADALRGLPAQGLDVYGYVSNYFTGHSPATARELQQRLGLPSVDPGSIGEQTSLF